MATTAIAESFMIEALRAANMHDYIASFTELGIVNLTVLCTHKPSFAPGGAAATADLDDLFAALRNTAATPAFPDARTSIDTIILSAQGLQEHAIKAIAAALAAGPAATAGATSVVATPAADTATMTAAQKTESYKKTGKRMYEVYQTTHNNSNVVPVSERVSYEVIGKLHEAITTCDPIIIPLAEFVLQLRTGSSKDETYIHMGKEYISKAEAASKEKIESKEDLYKQMERRAHAFSVAGCVSAEYWATERGDIAFDKVTHAYQQSKTQVASQDASGVWSVSNIDCFASPQGEDLQLKRMKELAGKNPHAEVRILKAVDDDIQKEIANLNIQCYTRDWASHHLAKKCPEMYNIHIAVAPESGESTATKNATGKRRAEDRSPEEQANSQQNTIEQQSRQIANLKAGKGRGGKGGGKAWQPAFNGGKGGGNPSFQGGYGNGYGGGFAGNFGNGGAANGASQQWPKAGTPGGLPLIPCPPDICKDFNFKVIGCARGTNCTRKHVCPVCGANHPWKGNH